MSDRDDHDDGSVIGGLIFALVCVAPFWALVAWEFYKGVLR